MNFLSSRLPNWRTIAAAVISLAFIGWCVAQLDLASLWSISSRLSAGQWLVLSLGLWLSYAVRATRLHQEFKGQVDLGWWDWLRISLLHNTLVNWLPLRAGEAAFPVLLRREAQVSLSESLSSLLWLRVQDAVVLLAVSLCGWPGWPWVTRLGLILLLALAVWALPHALRAAAERLTPTPEAGALAPRWRRLLVPLLSPHRHARAIWGLTLANWLLKLLVQAVLLVWLLKPSDPATAWLGAVGAEWAVFLPLQGWAGVGTYEAGSAWGMSLNGLDWAMGLQMALVMHVWVLLNATLAGGLAGLVTVRLALRP